MGTWRTAAGYVAGSIFVIGIIPITNALGGNQSAWIKFGFVIGILVILASVIAYAENRETSTESGAAVEVTEQTEEEMVPFLEAIGKLFHNKYWVLVLVMNLTASVIYGFAIVIPFVLFIFLSVSYTEEASCRTAS